MRASEIMHEGIVEVSPELGLREFEELLTVEDISGVPVTGPDGKLIGIASKTDIVRILSEQASENEELFDPALTVEDIMTREVVTVSPDEDVKSIARHMIDGQLHRVLVMRDSEVVGIVTAFDLLKLLC
jgi:CBS domain-containing protein